MKPTQTELRYQLVLELLVYGGFVNRHKVNEAIAIASKCYRTDPPAKPKKKSTK